MMTSKQKNQIDKLLGQHERKIAKERDDLENLIANLEALRDDCQEAWDSLQAARDALSRLV